VEVVACAEAEAREKEKEAAWKREEEVHLSAADGSFLVETDFSEGDCYRFDSVVTQPEEGE